MGISVISVVADFLTFYFIFFVLFCIDNRKRYINSNDIDKKQKFKQGIKKLLTTLGIAEIGYLSTKFLSTYAIFSSIDLDGSQVSITSTILAWIVYIIIVNLLLKKCHLF